MKIQVPEHIDLTKPERCRLVIEVDAGQFLFWIYPLLGDSDGFFYSIPKENRTSGLACFSDFFFDNEFFTLPFNQVQVLNHTPVFSSVPSLIFNEKEKNDYMQFLFAENGGKILCHTLQQPELTMLHEIPEETYRFLQRSFGAVQILHHTAPLIAYFHNKGNFVDGNRMIISRKTEGLDILCFSRDRLLLCNHFDYSHLNEALYYVLFIWKQLKFNQTKDFIYIAEETPDLTDLLTQYIRRVNPLDFAAKIPLEMAVLSR
ncbi:hypothetical protein AGMMS50262_02930 [Bacteroidia bacterium]|nr:hypothetical protein AGMMS50262_02930 [Bacteroidia bacterium]